MKKLLTGLSLTGLLLGACRTEAAVPQYSNRTGNGNGTSGAEVIFPADPTTQLRLVSIQWQSDTNTALLEFQSGVGAYSCLRTNRATTDTTQEVASTAGLITNRWLIYQRADGPFATNFKALIVATNNGTNIILGSGGFGTITRAGDSLYTMGETNSVFIGATTNWQNGEALYVGNVGRPIKVQLTPALTTNRIRQATAKYE